MKIEIYPPQTIHEIGQRPNQEDSVFPLLATEKDRMFILCDGMGGHEKGEVASQTVCDSMSCFINENMKGCYLSDELFHNAVTEACKNLDKIGDNSIRKMGTTMAFVYLHEKGAFMAHIGDSRIYHIRSSGDKILYKSRDHSLVYDLFMAGEITQEEMRTYSRKNVITRALMPQLEEKPQIDITHTTDILQGDYFYLCSDGMLEHMDDEELVKILTDEDMSDEGKKEVLIKETSGNSDNHSAILIHIADVTADDGLGTSDEQNVPYNAILMEKLSKWNHGVKREILNFVNNKALYIVLLCLILFLILFLIII